MPAGMARERGAGALLSPGQRSSLCYGRFGRHPSPGRLCPEPAAAAFSAGESRSKFRRAGRRSNNVANAGWHALWAARRTDQVSSAFSRPEHDRGPRPPASGHAGCGRSALDPVLRATFARRLDRSKSISPANRGGRQRGRREPSDQLSLATSRICGLGWLRPSHGGSLQEARHRQSLYEDRECNDCKRNTDQRIMFRERRRGGQSQGKGKRTT